MCSLCSSRGLFASEGSALQDGSAQVALGLGPLASTVSTFQALLSGYSWGGFGMGVTNTPMILTYGFPTGVPSQLLSDPDLAGRAGTFLTIRSEIQAMIRTSLNDWSAATGIAFVETPPELATISFYMLDLDGALPNSPDLAGLAYLPFGNVAGSTGPWTSYDAAAGDVIIDNDYASLAPQDLDFLRLVIAHEIGHAIGLKHPFETTSQNSATLAASLDKLSTTVMSYTYDGPPPSTPRTMDIDAIRHLYGPGTPDGSPFAWSFDPGTFVVTQTGSGAPDVIRGTGSLDIIRAGAGNDFVASYDAADQVFGEAGSDTIYGAEGDDALYGGSAETDPADAADLIFAGPGQDRVFGNGGNDTLYGGPGADIIFGGGGEDLIFGGNSVNDPVDIRDIIYGGAGADTIYGNGGDDLIYGGQGFSDPADASDWIYGGAGNDEIYGNGGNDNLFGNAGFDTLYGGAGADWLYGGENADTLSGGPGADNYVFDSPLGGGNVDRILDFTPGEDLVYLRSSIFGGLPTGSLSATAFNVGSAATRPSDRIIYNSQTGSLSFDPDGSGAAAATQFAILPTGIGLTADRFWIFA